MFSDLHYLDVFRNMRRARQKPRVRREVPAAAAPAGDITDSEYFTDCQSLAGIVPLIYVLTDIFFLLIIMNREISKTFM